MILFIRNQILLFFLNHHKEIEVVDFILCKALIPLYGKLTDY